MMVWWHRISQLFRSGSILLSNRDGNKVSEGTTEKVQTIFDVLRANPKISLQRLEVFLLQLSKNENIFSIHDEGGYNLLQKSVGLNHIELARWLLNRHHPDVNRSACSLPLHIACLKGYEECVELLLKHGARIDSEARLCFPGIHSHNCEESGKYKNVHEDVVAGPSHLTGTTQISQSNKLQNAIAYAIDGDQINILNLLAAKLEDPWIPFRVRKPTLLHLACERGAWKCVQMLVTTRSDEINLMKEEYYPIHQAALHDGRFLELLIQHGAETTVKTQTQQMTLLHVVILVARKSAEDTLNSIRILLEHGCKGLINAPDSLGNTPIHCLIVRYALEEARYGYDKWTKWDVLHLVRFLLQNGAKNSINQAGNSVLACVFRHIRDWELCFELLNMLIKEGGNPNIVGRDGSVPIMVCLVPLINKDPLLHFTHSMKVCYLNCIRILLEFGANPNCSFRSNLTPLHVLIFTVSENFTTNCDVQKRADFDFVKNLLLLLLQHGLDCNATKQNILQSVIDMIQNIRKGQDILCVYELALMLLQYGADPNFGLSNKVPSLPPQPASAAATALHDFGSVRIFHSPTADPAASSSSTTTTATTSNVGGSTSSDLRSSQRHNARNTILFYSIMLIVRKDFILTDPDLSYYRLIYLLYFSMRHDTLYKCLKSLHNLFIAQVPNKSIENLISIVSTLYKTPRSLKQLCRVCIYDSLDKKLAQNINSLNLPAPLKEYVLNFEM